MELSPGEIWWARPDATVGREQSGRRPVMVVSGTLYLETVTTLALVVPLTTTDRGWPNHVRVLGLPASQHSTFAMTEQVRVMARTRLVRRLGQATAGCLAEVRQWIEDYLVD